MRLATLPLRIWQFDLYDELVIEGGLSLAQKVDVLLPS
jgi:hypothetical protein